MKILKIMIYPTILIFSLLFLFILSVSISNAENIISTKKIYEWIINNEDKCTDIIVRKEMDITIGIIQVVEEEDISNLNYKYRWDLHRCYLIYLEGNENRYYKKGVYFDVRYYKDLASAKSRQYIEWQLMDVDGDGLVDNWSRDFKLLFTTDDGADEVYQYISPDWPKNFVNDEWYKPGGVKAQRVYNDEVIFWLNYIEKKGENNEK